MHGLFIKNKITDSVGLPALRPLNFFGGGGQRVERLGVSMWYLGAKNNVMLHIFKFKICLEAD